MKTNNKKFYVDIMADNDGVTGSLLLLSINYPNKEESRRIIVDCGISQGEGMKPGEELKFNSKVFFNPQQIETVIITHPHADHIGRLPILVKKNYSGKINLTKNASKVIPYAMPDNFRISKNKAKMLKMEKNFSLEDVDNVLSNLSAHNFNDTIDLGDGLRFTFFKNGHLAGAALVLIQVSFPGEDDINILFTGDYNDTNPLFKVEPLPNWVLELPITVVTESTYGIDKHSDDPCLKVFEKNILRALKEGKQVICPCCALERSQIILYLIKCLQDTGKLSVDIPIEVDGGLAIQYTRIYQNSIELDPEITNNLLPKNLEFITRKKRKEHIAATGPKIVIASGGMGSYGAANVWITSKISRKDAMIHFTCYLANGTFGRKLFDTLNEESIEFRGEKFVKKAEICFTSEFSAHARGDKIISFLKQFKRLKFVVVTHGEPEIRELFSGLIRKEIKGCSAAQINSEVFHRINSSGLVKSQRSKFKYN